ncbi:MAG TPA: hypothetical protein ENI92_03530 [Bacteroidetes bacterium]|nr:hypothetical protein [Bacteroidota bacterium]
MDALDGKDYQAISERLEWYKDKHRKALRHAQYCGDQWEYYEDRADRLAVIADTLASYINEGLPT